MRARSAFRPARPARAGRRLVLALVAPALVAGGVATPAVLAAPATAALAAPAPTPVPAAAGGQADPLGGGMQAGDLQARVDALQRQVDALQVAEEVAAEQADAANAALVDVVSRQVQAQERQEAAARSLEAARAQAGARARAVQQAGGGRLALVLGALHGSSPADVLDGYQAVSSLMGADADAVRAAHTQVAVADADTALVLALRRRQLDLTATTLAAQRTAQDALARSNALLAAAGAQVVALADAERAQQDAAATADAAGSVTAWGADPDAPAPTQAAAVAIAAARTRLGDPYVWGATGPDEFDCSGLTQWAYAQAGIALPRTTKELYADLPSVSVDDLAPGDLVLFATDPTDASTIHHVGLYIGGGLMIHAPHTGDVVRIAAVTRADVFAVVRPSGPLAP